jgi:hypothetical protein
MTPIFFRTDSILISIVGESSTINMVSAITLSDADEGSASLFRPHR